jgi:enterochelin esterase-like enzyme
VPSAQVGPRNVTIWLPPGYDNNRRRYPVIYMHDGQNVFEPGSSYGGQEWGVDEALSAMIADGRSRGAIVVGIWNTNLRGREYLPTKVAARLSPEARALVEATHGGASLADGYLRFIVEELRPQINRRFRTSTARVDTSIMGSSMGGLISLYALGEYPEVFGSAAALSIHWPLGDPRRGQGAPQAEVIAAFDGWLAETRLRPGRNRLYMDHGTINLDGYYRPYSEAMEAVMARQGWRRNRDWVSRVFEGTDHNEAAWRARIEEPLTFLLYR